MRLLQITDCHLFADPTQCGPGGVNPYQGLEHTLRLGSDLQPGALLLTGDISADDSPQSYQHLISLIDRYLPGVSWRCIPGNHDQNLYYQHYLADSDLTLSGSWQLGGWQVHGLDTRWQGTRGKVDPAQLDVLASVLGKFPQQGHILALHHHVLPTYSWMDRHDLVNAGVLRDWLDAQPIPLLVLHGHIHASMEHQQGKSTILGAPSSAWQWQLSEQFGLDAQAPGLRIIELGQQNDWQSSIRRIE